MRRRCNWRWALSARRSVISVALLALMAAMAASLAEAQTVRVWGKNSQQPKNGKRFRIQIGARLGPGTDLAQVLKTIEEFDADEVTVGGAEYVAYEDFPKVSRKIDAAAMAEFRKQLQVLKSKGLILRGSAGGRDPIVPGDPVSLGRPGGRAIRGREVEETPYFFDVYPEARNLSNGVFWKFIESKTAEYFRKLPEVDSVRSYFWETQLLNDTNYFRDFYWADTSKTLHTLNLGPQQYYSDVDYLVELLSALGRGAQRFGKEYQWFAFCHYPHQEQLNIRALRQLDRNLPISLYHFISTGDWHAWRPTNNIALEVTDRETTLAFTSTEYWGAGEIPYCHPEDIQQRLHQVMKRNPNITTIVVGSYSRAAGPSEINTYALQQLARDPYTPIETIWQTWAERKYGKAAAPTIIKALQRTFQIGKLLFYFKGTLTSEHSQTADLDYLEGEATHTARANIEWMPWDHENNFYLEEFLYRPREHTVQVAMAEKQEALRLIDLCLGDVESVRSVLPPAEYRILKDQFTLQRHWAEQSMPHLEAFLRVKIQKTTPSAENLAKLKLAVAALEKKTDEVEKLYGNKYETLNADRLRNYIQQVRDAIAGFR